MKSILLSAIASLLLLSACQSEITPVPFVEQEPNLPDNPNIYSDVQYPLHFSELQNNIDQQGNLLPFQQPPKEISDKAAQLGHLLFYDKRLSINNTISCASCHKQAFGFADPVASSVGFKGATTPRNSMAIINPMLNNHFFWDSRVNSAHALALEPVQNHIEMGMESIPNLIDKLAASSYYPNMFQEAFETTYASQGTHINETTISLALAHFLHSMVSYNSKFDQGVSNNFADYSPLELMGKDLFFGMKARCSSCHSGGNFDAPDGQFEPYGGRNRTKNPKGTANIGLETHYADNGMEKGQFKIPSLRNIGVTAPYMHDGRFQSLEEVVRHYSTSIQPHTNLDPKFRTLTGEVVRMNLSELEIQALVAFLHTLTDESFLNDPKFADPFLH